MRQGAIDTAKGIAILCMIQVHLMELFARQSIYDGFWGRISLFVGGPFVAPLFLAIMGYFLAQSRRSTQYVLLRGLAFIGVGGLLNIGLNAHLLLKIHQGAFSLNPWEYVLGVDILFAAGLSTILLAGLRKIWDTSIAPYLMLACGIVLLTPAFNTALVVDSWGKYLLAFASGEYAWGYFPLFPWFVYPLSGYVYAVLEKRALMSGLSPVAQVIGSLCLALGVAGTSPYAVRVSTNLHSYYHHNGRFVLWTIGGLMLWMLLVKILHRHLGKHLFLKYLKWLGRHVTTVYVLQWLIIGNLATGLFRTQSLTQLLLWYAGILIVVSVTIYLVPRCLSISQRLISTNVWFQLCRRQ